ncbi:MAG: hypothetical protein RLO50_03615 [Azospirillaceae bacterium]
MRNNALKVGLDPAAPYNSGIYSGSTKFPNLDVHLSTVTLQEVFQLALNEGVYDVAELSLARTLMAIDRGACEYRFLPIFPYRRTRLDTIYVQANGARTVDELRGSRIGVPRFDQTAIMTARGVLQDLYGLSPEDVKWVLGPVDEQANSNSLISETGAQSSAPEKSLSDQLHSGSISALISLRPPNDFHTGAFRRLFDDVAKEDKQYVSLSGFLPIMHMIGVHRRIGEYGASDRRETVIRSLMTGFWQANAAVDPMPTSLTKQDRAALAAASRWAHAQGLISRPIEIDQEFEMIVAA